MFHWRGSKRGRTSRQKQEPNMTGSLWCRESRRWRSYTHSLREQPTGQVRRAYSQRRKLRFDFGLRRARTCEFPRTGIALECNRRPRQCTHPPQTRLHYCIAIRRHLRWRALCNHGRLDRTPSSRVGSECWRPSSRYPCTCGCLAGVERLSYTCYWLRSTYKPLALECLSRRCSASRIVAWTRG